MGKYFNCPNCGAKLEKSPNDQILGKVAGFVLSGSSTENCPVCGASIDRLSIIEGKYDVKPSWKFWVRKSSSKNEDSEDEEDEDLEDDEEEEEGDYDKVEKMGRKRDVKGLTAFILGQHDSSDRQVATRYLGKIRNDDAINGLLKALKQSDADGREFAAEELSDSKNKRIVQPLIDTLAKDSVQLVRYWSVIGLSKFYDSKVSHALIDALNNDSSPDVRRAAVEALSNFCIAYGADEYISEALTKATDDPDGAVKIAALGAIKKL